MNRLVVATLGLASLGLACEPSGDGPAPAPATTVGALDSVFGNFTVTGAIRIGTGECNGGTAQLRRVDNTASFVWRGTDQSTGAVLTADTGVTLGPNNADNSRSYSALLQRDANGNYLNWKMGHPGFPNRAFPSLFYGSHPSPATGPVRSRELRYEAGSVLSPASGDATRDFDLANLVSVEFEIGSTGWASIDDDIVSLLILASATGTGLPRTNSSFSSSVCHGEGQANNAANSCLALSGAGPREVNGFIRTYTVDAGGARTGQRIRAELLLLPGRTYNIDFRAQYRDQFTVATEQSFTTQGPCTTAALSVSDSATCAACDVSRPDQGIGGTLFFEPDDLSNGGPRAVEYYPQFFNDDNSVRTGFTPSGTLITTLDAPDGGLSPLAFSWNGVPAGRYRMDNDSSALGAGLVEYGHVLLDWGSDSTQARYRPPTPFNNFPPLYRWPRAGAAPAGEVTTSLLGLDASGHFYLDAGERQLINRYSPMAYLRGTVSFVGGCDYTAAIITAGSAEFDGVGSDTGPGFTDEKSTPNVPSVTGNFDAFARGLFRAGTHVDAGQFELAASVGAWREKVYRLRLDDGDGYDGSLFVWPATGREVTITGSGVANANTALVGDPLELEVTRIGVVLRIPDDPIAFPEFQDVILRAPRLQVGDDVRVSGAFPGRVPYSDLSGNVLGAYTATSSAGTVSLDGKVANIQIIAMANSVVDIKPSAQVSEDNGATWPAEWSAFPAVGVELSGSCGTCLDGDLVIQDTDGGPDVVVTGDSDADPAVALLSYPAGTTQIVLAGTASDDTPVTFLSVGGQQLAVSEAGEFSITVGSLVSGTDNILTLIAKDCVGNETTMQVIIRVAAPLCPPAETPDMCEVDASGAPAAGSAFYVSVVGPGNIEKSILCTVSAVGQAPVCDTTTLYDTQCGN